MLQRDMLLELKGLLKRCRQKELLGNEAQQEFYRLE
eukprot:gene3569-3837_t